MRRPKSINKAETNKTRRERYVISNYQIQIEGNLVKKKQTEVKTRLTNTRGRWDLQIPNDQINVQIYQITGLSKQVLRLIDHYATLYFTPILWRQGLNS